MFTVAQLAETLTRSPESNFVRVVARWLDYGEVTDTPPTPTGSDLVDALVAAAVAHRAHLLGVDAPPWTNEARLNCFWHPGEDVFFANALANSPQAFANRGILIESASLESV